MSLSTGPSSFLQLVCSICDELILPNEAQTHLYADLPARVQGKMRQLLAAPAGMDPLLRQQYYVPGEDLQDLLLSKQGVNGQELTFCRECLASLRSSSDGPPKFAIANHLWLGVLPMELRDLRRVEISLCSMVRAIPSTILSYD